MKRILVMYALFSMGAVAFANPCPKGNNVRLGDRTGAGQNQNTQMLNNAGATPGTGRGMSAGGASLRNHFPH